MTSRELALDILVGCICVIVSGCVGGNAQNQDLSNAAESARTTGGSATGTTTGSGSNSGSHGHTQPIVTSGPLSSSASCVTNTALPNLTYYKDIAPLIDVKCNSCHDAGGIGPFTLTSYSDMQANLQNINQDVNANVMPPWPPSDACNDYLNDLSLSCTQKNQVLSWIAAGAPAGNPNDYVPGVDPTAPTPLRVDASYKMAKPFKVLSQPDEYRCFILDANFTNTTYAVGFGLIPGNSSIVHHAIVQIVSAANANSVIAEDGQDGSPGWDCGQSGASLNWLYAWAPGGRTALISPDASVGTKLSPGDMLVLQMHYHVTTSLASAAPDQSTFVMQLSPSVPKVGQMVQLLDLEWVAGGMSIPANAPDTAYSASFDPSLSSLINGTGSLSGPLAIYNVGTHMHQRGTQGIMHLTSDSQDTCLIDIPAWNFHWQNSYPLAQPIPLTSSDQVSLTCHWNNTAANQPVVNGVKETPRDLNWGEGSDDEMCLGFVYVAPP